MANMAAATLVVLCLKHRLLDHVIMEELFMLMAQALQVLSPLFAEIMKLRISIVNVVMAQRQ